MCLISHRINDFLLSPSLKAVSNLSLSFSLLLFTPVSRLNTNETLYKCWLIPGLNKQLPLHSYFLRLKRQSQQYHSNWSKYSVRMRNHKLFESHFPSVLASKIKIISIYYIELLTLNAYGVLQKWWSIEETLTFFNKIPNIFIICDETRCYVFCGKK